MRMQPFSPPPQAAAVPRMLEGRDVVATARTGSGKTLAYLLPVLHRILAASSNDGPRAAWQGLVLVPTRELSDQVSRPLLFVRASGGCASSAQ